MTLVRSRAALALLGLVWGASAHASPFVAVTGACALGADGTTYCAGPLTGSGELVPVPGLSPAEEIVEPLPDEVVCARLRGGGTACIESPLYSGSKHAFLKTDARLRSLGGPCGVTDAGELVCNDSFGEHAAVRGGVQTAAYIGGDRAFALVRRSDGTVVQVEGQYGSAGIPSDALAGLRGVIDITTAQSRACVIVRGGTVRCVGREDEGALAGDGITEAIDVALDKDGAGGCALRSTGRVSCWGGSGPLAPGMQQRPEGGRAAWDMGVDDAAAIAVVHGRLCIAGKGGGMRCLDRLPVPTRVSVPAAVDVTLVTRPGDEGFACALGRDGAVHCWGQLEDDGPLRPPTAITLPGPGRAIAASHAGLAVWLDSGLAFGPLAGEFRHLTGDRWPHGTPHTAPGALRVDNSRVCGVDAKGRRCCVEGGGGEPATCTEDAALGYTKDDDDPQGTVAIAAGDAQRYAIGGDGTLRGVRRRTSYVVAGLSDVQRATVAKHTWLGHVGCAVTRAGEVRCWGLAPPGVLGHRWIEMPGPAD